MQWIKSKTASAKLLQETKGYLLILARGHTLQCDKSWKFLFKDKSLQRVCNTESKRWPKRWCQVYASTVLITGNERTDSKINVIVEPICGTTWGIDYCRTKRPWDSSPLSITFKEGRACVRKWSIKKVTEQATSKESRNRK